ncbi:DNA-binding protein [Actinoplanes sp. NPDC051475]|uniref:helix-turn-helix transcriptional regulator n=1 Tax=Actinoplanes sp. NPDC051475 TaxID=3157225 RepID=UPI00344FA1B5
MTPHPDDHDAADLSETLWSPARIRALGAVTDVPTAASIFRIGRSTAYELIQLDTFPAPVIRAGDRVRIPVAGILAALQIPLEAHAEEPPPPT